MVLLLPLALSLYLLIVMQIGWGILLIVGPLLGLLCSLGIVLLLGDCCILWELSYYLVCQKQATVSRSSIKGKYRALASSAAELCLIRMLLQDLGVFLPLPPLLWCDNVSALVIASNPMFHARTKHIEVDYHFVCERVLKRDLLVKFISSSDQLVDIFTKGLPSPRFHWLTSNSCGNSPFV